MLSAVRRRSLQGTRGKFLTLQSVAHCVRSHLCAGSGDPINHTDPSGLDYTTDHMAAGGTYNNGAGNAQFGGAGPLNGNTLASYSVASASVLMVLYGSDYTDHNGELHNVVTNPYVPGIRGSSTDFVRMLESSDAFIYQGHHFWKNDFGFPDQSVLLSDGYFFLADLLGKAKSLPRYIFVNACNSVTSLSGAGYATHPTTTFIGVEGYTDKMVAARATNLAKKALTSGNPMDNLRKYLSGSQYHIFGGMQ